MTAPLVWLFDMRAPHYEEGTSRAPLIDSPIQHAETGSGVPVWPEGRGVGQRPGVCLRCDRLL